MNKNIRVFDIGTPWGVFDVMSSYFTRQKEINHEERIARMKNAGIPTSFEDNTKYEDES